MITPSILLPWHHDVINNPYSLADDFEFVGTDSRTSFSARLYKFVKAALITYYYNNYYLETINRAASKFYPPGTPPFNEVNKRTDLVFVNTHKMMGYARAYVPTVVEVGGLHIKPPKSLPSDIEQFISGAGEHGFIYFSLGTFVSGTIITKNIQKSILNVFGRMPQRVLWKWNKQIPDAPSNVKFSKWLPQADILAHENIKLSISHGGMLSVQEALYHGVPLLILPILYDQNTNAFLAEKKDFGKSLSFCHFKEDLFENYVKTLVNNATLRQKVKQISRGIKHQNRDLRERINWWIDFIDNYRGTKILEPVLPYQKWFDVSYDLFLFFLFILIVTMYLIFYLCSISMKNVIIIRSARRKKNE